MSYDLVVVGLGYVGQPLLALAAKQGLRAHGIDINPAAVEAARALGLDAGSDYGTTAAAAATVICVPTPVDERRRPDYGPVKAAVAAIAPHLQEGALVVLESTVGPGTTQELVHDALNQPGRPAVLVAHCPERIDPGNEQWHVGNLPRVVAGTTPAATQAAQALYERLLNAPVMPLSSVLAAEATKVVENSFRDINIAFVNELAMSFDALGINVKEVIDGAATKPFGFLPHYPGCGVGGHCIPVDPYYLIERAAGVGFDHRFLRLARTINEGMPQYAVDRLLAGLESAGIDPATATVALLGLAYKPGVADERESPSRVIHALLQGSVGAVRRYDPLVATEWESLDAALDGADAAILATAHNEFVTVPAETWGRLRVLIDGRNCLDHTAIEATGCNVHGIGA